MKYILDKLYYYYIEIYIYWGLIGLAFKLIYFAYVLVKKMNNEHSFLLEDIYEYFTKTNIFIVIFLQFFYYFFINGLYILLLFLSIYYLQPNHIIIAPEMFNAFLSNMFYTENTDKYYTLIPRAFQILSLLFYFEILELNFCKLNKNTVKNILARERDDAEVGILINNDNIDLPGGEYELDSLEGDTSSL